jgi:hypothetical protein
VPSLREEISLRGTAPHATVLVPEEGKAQVCAPKKSKTPHREPCSGF